MNNKRKRLTMEYMEKEARKLLEFNNVEILAGDLMIKYLCGIGQGMEEARDIYTKN